MFKDTLYQEKKITTTKYINLQEIIDTDPTVKQWAIVSQRSIGKSTAGAEYVIDKWFNNGLKFIWLRSTEKQVLNYCKVSKGYWYKKGIKIKDNYFYDIKTDEMCGIGIGLENSHVYSSGFFDEYYTNVWDEFIPSKTERKVKGLYGIYANFIKTVERDKPEFISILLGNAWTKNNAIFQAWRYKYKEGFTKVKKKNGDESNIMVFCANRHYYNISNAKTSLASELAEFDPELELMINDGSFSFDDDRTIWQDNIVPKRDLLYYLEIDNKKYEVWELRDNSFIFVSNPRKINPEYVYLNFTLKDTAKSGGLGRFVHNKEVKEYVDSWLLEMKSGKLFFDKYDTRDDIITFIQKVKGYLLK